MTANSLNAPAGKVSSNATALGNQGGPARRTENTNPNSKVPTHLILWNIELSIDLHIFLSLKTSIVQIGDLNICFC
jgi:hypothetical protein